MHVMTPVNVQRLKTELNNHPDHTFVSYLLCGLVHGFHTGIKDLPCYSIECKNLRSAMSQPLNIVADLIDIEVAKGYVIGPFADIPFSNYRINPIGIAVGKYSQKKRLIVDLSAPHDMEFNPSINELIDKEDFSLQYVNIDDAIRIIKQMGHGSLLIKTDITDAFKTIPMLPELWPFHGVKWDNKYYFFKQLVFGSRSSPKIFDTLSRAICWIATNNYDIRNILHLLDDFLVVVPPEQDPHSIMSRFLGIFHSLNIPLSEKKTEGPATKLEYLGIFLDSEKMEASLPSEKISRILEILDTVKMRSSCTKRELLSLLGHLNFACRVILPGRSFISHLIALSTTVSKLHHHVYINKACRSDMHMWSLFLKQWNGVSFFINDNITQSADMQLYTDATDRSFAGFYNNRWFQGFFPEELLDGTSMAFCELYPIVMACVLWGHQWNRLRILFHCDNEATVEIIRKGRSKKPSIMRLMRKLTYISAINHFVIHAQHIPGKQNTIADALSRFQMTKFRRLAPQADLYPVECVAPTELLMN